MLFKQKFILPFCLNKQSLFLYPNGYYLFFLININLLYERIDYFFCLFCFYSKSFGAQQASQILSSELPQVLEIEKIIVENIEYNRDDPMPNMKIKETNPLNADNSALGLYRGTLVFTVGGI